MKKYLSQKYISPVTHNALRIVTGLLFWQHGAQKILGWLGSRGAAEPPSLFWWAGILELVGGGLIALGLFTRPVAFLLAGGMAVAYFRSHAPRGFWPIMNGGELSALYCFIYLWFVAHGGGSFSLDGLLARRRGGQAEGS
jgi:putative oxidoreductase